MEKQLVCNNTPATIFETTTMETSPMATVVPVVNLKQVPIDEDLPNIDNNNDKQDTNNNNNNNNNEEGNNNMKEFSNLLAILTPHHQTSFKIGKFNPLDIKQFLHNTITQINANKYFHPLLVLDRKSLSQVKAE